LTYPIFSFIIFGRREEHVGGTHPRKKLERSMWAGPTLFYREEHVGGTHLFLFLNLGACDLELGAWSLVSFTI